MLLCAVVWLEHYPSAAGASVLLELEDLGAKGWAEVLEIGPCPEIVPGPSSVVTATFAHQPTSEILDVTISVGRQSPGGMTLDQPSIQDTSSPASETIGVTANHPFWSVDHQAFVPIGQLQPGSLIKTHAGQLATITSLLARPGPAEQVYNLEVHGEHVYYVGAKSVLVHNSYDSEILGRNLASGAANPRAYLAKSRGLGVLNPPTADPTSSPETIGVTGNHPFWSLDRAEFVQAGELAIGERLQTLAGDIKWVQQKLPRPGPEPVYNLEVQGEHVYYVGDSGVLAHNAGSKYTTHVYVIHDKAGNVKYVGITKWPWMRQLKHKLLGNLKKGETMTLITSKLTHHQARTMESKLIYGFIAKAARAGSRSAKSSDVVKQLGAVGLRNKNRGRDPDRWITQDVFKFINEDLKSMFKGIDGIN